MHQRHSVRRSAVRVLGLAALLAITSLATPVLRADPPPPATESEVLDPVVSEVVAMLEGGVAAGIVERWLETTAARPEALTARDLIALTAAGAPEGLIRRLLDTVAPSGPPPSEPVLFEKVAPEPQAGAVVAPGPASPREVSQPAPTSPERVASAASLAAAPSAEVSFEIDYRPIVGEDEESWDLYLYLDGSPLAWLPPAAPLRDGTLTFSRPLPPGRHSLRALQERHEPSGRNWRHRARAQAREWVFEVEPGEGWVVRLELREARFRPRGAALETSWRVLRGSEVYADEAVNEEDFESWAPLCEELETSFDPGAKVPRALRSEMDRCIRWAELWPGREELPSRAEVRELLARYDYRPLPAGTR